MRLPTESGPWVVLDEVDSTQEFAKRSLSGDGQPPGVVFAHHQTEGRGRFGRTWVSERGGSLTFSMVFGAYADHPKPWLVGMAVAVAAAGVLHVQIRWPNDLAIERRKVGGILTELCRDRHRRQVPVVGVGVNLTQTEFPEEIAETATSLAMHRHGPFDAEALARKIVARLEDLPEPDDWKALEPIWEMFDDTPGKQYRLPDGTFGTAIGIGPDGSLLCSVDGETRTVLAAEALFGRL
ncbi:MAG: biotin--[acetyl-CoA-carboxylase] ligase [Fimbriimonadales bacterium]|nr:biotin--[acetyl-CoA-carboxylase] ligase [Fimbriimonadales bacterium]